MAIINNYMQLLITAPILFVNAAVAPALTVPAASVTAAPTVAFIKLGKFPPPTDETADNIFSAVPPWTAIASFSTFFARLIAPPACPKSASAYD